MFDMRYAGANGVIGIQLLDFNGSEYVNAAEDFFHVAEGFFTGYEYSVEVKAGENGSYLISRSGGSRMSIQGSGISGSAIGMVTGAYFLEVLEKDGINYIRIKQYVAGEDKTDHVGDVVGIVGLSDGGLTLLEEKTEAGSLDEAKKTNGREQSRLAVEERQAPDWAQGSLYVLDIYPAGTAPSVPEIVVRPDMTTSQNLFLDDSFSDGDNIITQRGTEIINIAGSSLQGVKVYTIDPTGLQEQLVKRLYWKDGAWALLNE